MIPDSASPISFRRVDRINLNPDHDIRDRDAGPSTTRTDHYRPISDDWRPREHGLYLSGDMFQDAQRDWQRRPAHTGRLHFRDLQQTSVKWVRPNSSQSDKRLSRDKSPHVQGRVQPCVPSDLRFDYTNVPKGPRIDKSLPHIFIPASAIPPNELTVSHLFKRIRRIRRPSAVEQDYSGYYIFFGQHARSTADLQTCFDALNGEKLFSAYTMDMQVFFNGQDIFPTKVAAGRQKHGVDTDNEPYPNIDRSQVTAEHDNMPRQLENVPVINSNDLLIPKSASPVLGYTPSESSSRLNARKCHICKKTSPLDFEQLIACSSCKRMYHKGCHTRPAVSNYNIDWQCCYCSKKKKVLASPTMDMAVSTNADIPMRSSVEGHSPRHKRARLDESLAPETVLPPAIKDEELPHELCNDLNWRDPCRRTDIEAPLLSTLKESSGSPCHNGRSATTTKTVARVACSTVSSSEFPDASTGPQQSVFCFRRLAAISVLESGHTSLPFPDVAEKIARQVPDLSPKVWRNDLITALIKESDCETPLFRLWHRHLDGEEGQEVQAWCNCSEHAVLMAERPHLVSVSLRGVRGLSSIQQEADVQGSLAPQPLCASKASHSATSVGRQDISTSPASSISNVLAAIDKTALQRVLTPTMHHDNMDGDASITKHMYESKMDEIRARPSRKQIFGTPYSSRLGKAKCAKLDLHRQATLHKLPSEDGKDKIAADAESFDSIEQLLDLPEMVVPMVFKGRLAFRDANQTYDGRLRRPKGMFEVEAGDSD